MEEIEECKWLTMELLSAATCPWKWRKRKEEEEGGSKKKSRRWLKKNKVAGGFRCIETRRGNWGIIGRDYDG